MKNIIDLKFCIYLHYKNVYMKASIMHIINAIGILNISLLFKGFNDAFKTDSSWISDEGIEILNNPEDREKVEEAIKKLKENKDHDFEKVELSSGKTINIRID